MERNGNNFVTYTTAVQVEIKRLILSAFATGKSRRETFEKAEKIIEKYSKRINDVQLRKEFETSLAKATVQWYGEIQARVDTMEGAFGLPFVALVRALNETPKQQTKIKVSIQKGGDETETLFQSPKYGQNGITGTPYDDDVRERLFEDRVPIKDVQKKIKNEIAKLVKDLATAQAQDEDGRPIRARAEMYVRREAQVNSIEEMRRAGVKLVWASTHVDCSPRCYPWQGRLYSLDGTTGTTEDGIQYIPLETATNILTPNGKWFNGLLGFNCRHRLIPYHPRQEKPKGYSIAEARAHYKIDQTQRRMEREIRQLKENALLFESLKDKTISKQLSAKAEQMTNEYRQFCRQNDTVAMIYRTRVTTEERAILKTT